MSNDDSFPTAQGDHFQPGAPAKKSGGSSKLLLGLGIGCGGVLLLCGGVGVFLYFQAASFVEDLQITDPVVIAQKTSEITDITIPEGFEPTNAMDMKIPFTDDRMMLMTTYMDEENRSNILVVAEFNEEMGGDQNMDQVMSDSLEEQGHEQGNLDLGDSEEFVHEVRGTEVTFQIISGTRDEEEEVWQVSGTFDGKSGQPAFVSLTVDKEKMSREDVEAFIKSIK